MRIPLAKCILVSLIVLVPAMALCCSASAKEVHVLSSHFGAGELSLNEESGLGVNQATGDVYLSDTGDNRIAKYGSSGEPFGTLATVPGPTFLAVDNSPGASNGDIYVVEQGGGAIAKLDSSGAPVISWGTAGRMEGFSGIAGIAVDPSGNLFVMETPDSESALHEFGPGGAATGQCAVPVKTPEGQHAAEFAAGAHGLAVDAHDELFYLQAGPAEISSAIKLSSSCELLPEPTAQYSPLKFSSGRQGFAVDEGNDTLATSGLFRGLRDQLTVYSTDGTPQITEESGAPAKASILPLSWRCAVSATSSTWPKPRTAISLSSPW